MASPENAVTAEEIEDKGGTPGSQPAKFSPWRTTPFTKNGFESSCRQLVSALLDCEQGNKPSWNWRNEGYLQLETWTASDIQRKPMQEENSFVDETIWEDEQAVDPPSSDEESLQQLQWTFSIVYSHVWSVPVLYMMVQRLDGTPLPRSQILPLLEPSSSSSSKEEFLSCDEHPMTGIPSFFLHPCRTAEKLSVLECRSETTRLWSWMAMVLSTVRQPIAPKLYVQVVERLSKNTKVADEDVDQVGLHQE